MEERRQHGPSKERSAGFPGTSPDQTPGHPDPSKIACRLGGSWDISTLCFRRNLPLSLFSVFMIFRLLKVRGSPVLICF